MTISASTINSALICSRVRFTFSLLLRVWVAQEPLCHTFQKTEMHPAEVAYIEHDFPIEGLNRTAQKEGNAKKPIYQMHKW